MFYTAYHQALEIWYFLSLQMQTYYQCLTLQTFSIRYDGVPMNGPSVSAFRKEVCQLWWKVLKRRSHKHRLIWDRMKRLMDRWLPPARVCHPYPLVRFGVIT